jgi:hypothetical protein
MAKHDRQTDGRPHDGEAASLAHHLTVDDAKRRLMMAALRYSDQLAKLDARWLFSEHLLYVDWIEERKL